MKKVRKYILTCILIASILITWSSIVFSQTKYASCYGFYYAWNENTCGSADSASLFYKSAGYTSFSYHDYNANYALSHLSSDNIFFFNGHAGWDGLDFYNGSSFSYLTMTGIANKDLSRMTLAVLGGCESAQGTSNITRAFSQRGAKCAIGWTTTIRVPQTIM
ncbi:UNVERIFIED_CONTAM: hypothetical protein Cloal_2117 [Acetivibrio alkalicellulosi]